MDFIYFSTLYFLLIHSAIEAKAHPAVNQADKSTFDQSIQIDTVDAEPWAPTPELDPLQTTAADPAEALSGSARLERRGLDNLSFDTCKGKLRCYGWGISVARNRFVTFYGDFLNFTYRKVKVVVINPGDGSPKVTFTKKTPKRGTPRGEVRVNGKVVLWDCDQVSPTTTFQKLGDSMWKTNLPLGGEEMSAEEIQGFLKKVEKMRPRALVVTKKAIETFGEMRTTLSAVAEFSERLRIRDKKAMPRQQQRLQSRALPGKQRGGHLELWPLGKVANYQKKRGGKWKMLPLNNLVGNQKNKRIGKRNARIGA